jgi:hypothetical protein
MSAQGKAISTFPGGAPEVLDGQVVMDDTGDAHMRIQVRTCDDWIAVYKNGERVWSTHSCPLTEGLRALGIDFEAEDIDDQMDEYGGMKDGSDPFPERLPQ